MKKRMGCGTAALSVILALNAILLVAQWSTSEWNAEPEEVFRRSYFANMENSGCAVEPNLRLKMQGKQEVCLKDVVANSNRGVLVLRFTEMYCHSCVQSVVKITEKALTTEKYDKFVVIGHRRNDILFKREIKELGLEKYRHANIKDLGIPAERMRYPYLFVVTRDLKVSNVFVPDKMDPQATKEYIHNVAMRKICIE